MYLYTNIHIYTYMCLTFSLQAHTVLVSTQTTRSLVGSADTFGYLQMYTFMYMYIYMFVYCFLFFGNYIYMYVYMCMHHTFCCRQLDNVIALAKRLVQRLRPEKENRINELSTIICRKLFAT